MTTMKEWAALATVVIAGVYILPYLLIAFGA